MLPISIFPKNYNIKFYFYEEDDNSPADFDKIEIRLISTKTHNEEDVAHIPTQEKVVREALKQ